MSKSHPSVTPDVSDMVDRIRGILIKDYDAPEDKITININLWADGDFAVIGKSGVEGSKEYIESLDAKTQEVRHVVRYHDSADEGIMYRKHLNAENYETEIYAE